MSPGRASPCRVRGIRTRGGFFAKPLKPGISGGMWEGGQGRSLETQLWEPDLAGLAVGQQTGNSFSGSNFPLFLISLFY